MRAADSLSAPEHDLVHALFDAALPDAVFVHDCQGRIRAVNQEACRSLGYSREELLGLTVADTTGDVDLPSAQLDWQGMKPGERATREGCQRRKDGSVLPVDIHVGVLDHAGERLYVTTVRETTWEKRESEARLKATFDQAAVGIAHLHLDGQLLSANTKFWEILGVNAEHQGALPASESPFNGQKWRMTGIESVLAGERDSVSIERSHPGYDGQTTWANVTVSLARSPTGSAEHLIVVMEDITRRKMLEEKSEEHGRQMDALMKEQLIAQTAAALAHELNQPLEAISAYSEVALRALQSEAVWSEQMQRAVLGCNLQAQRAGQVLHDLIGQLRIEGSDAERLDLNILVCEALERVRTRESLNFKATIELDPTLPPVLGNSLQLEKVLHNLLRNGLDAMLGAGATDPAFNIRTQRAKDPLMAEISVQDSGPGIAPELANTLFRPFRSVKKGGLGLGLAISRSLIHAQGGQLWFERDASPGATFRFTVPIADDN
jgi:PAS domain S-box-containing protein